MNSNLSAAFEEASKLPQDRQEIFAAFLLAELKDDEEWSQSFAKKDSLLRLAEEARSEYDAGNTEPIENLLS